MSFSFASSLANLGIHRVRRAPVSHTSILVRIRNAERDSRYMNQPTYEKTATTPEQSGKGVNSCHLFQSPAINAQSPTPSQRCRRPSKWDEGYKTHSLIVVPRLAPSINVHNPCLILHIYINLSWLYHRNNARRYQGCHQTTSHFLFHGDVSQPATSILFWSLMALQTPTTNHPCIAPHTSITPKKIFTPHIAEE